MLENELSTAVGQSAACALVTQQARVRIRSGQVSWVRFFRGFFSPVRQMSGSFRPQGPWISFSHHYHPYSFIAGANDLRCWRALISQIYKLENELCSTVYSSAHSPTFPSQLILQPFCCFIYITAHSPTLLLLHLRHSSFSNPSFASPTSQALHLIHLASRPWAATPHSIRMDYPLVIHRAPILLCFIRLLVTHLDPMSCPWK